MNAPPPMVDGVGPSRQWLPAGRWKTVLEFLVQHYPGVSQAVWHSRLAKGQVSDQAGERLHAASPYRVGVCVYYYRELESETPIPFFERVLYQDEHLLVIDKPHFLPVIPAGRFLQETLLVRLRKQGQPDSLVPIHRLDRDTAGVMLFSRNRKTRGLFTGLFRERKVKKIYEALAPTAVALEFPLTRRSRIVGGEPFFRMKEVEGVANAETGVDVVEEMNGQTRYRLRPFTGRKHQLRVHLAALGIPIVNDKLYPEVDAARADEMVAVGSITPAGLPAWERRSEGEDYSTPLKLLAKSISFPCPLTGRECYFETDRKL